jgi:hypothetical protein
VIGVPALQLVPGFVFLGTFYWELKPEFRLYNQQFVPELNEDDAGEPYLQAQDSFALALHYRNVAMDAIGVQAMWKTVSVREAFESQVTSVGERLKGPTAASADICARLVRRSSVPFELVGAGTLFYHTPRDQQSPSVEFECIDSISLEQRNDRIGHVIAETPGGTQTDQTTDAQNPATNVSPSWGAAPAYGSILYAGHQSAMFTEIAMQLPTLGVRILDAAIEYYEGRYNQGTPTAVSQIAGGLKFDLSGFLGTKNRKGTKVRIFCVPTSVYEDLEVQFIAGAPASVAIDGGGPRLKVKLNNLLGTDQANDGRFVRVRALVSGKEATLEVQWDGTDNYVLTPVSDPYLGQAGPGSVVATDYWIDTGVNYVETTAAAEKLLGQDPASLDPYQYTVGSLWREFEDVEDSTKLLTYRTALADTMAIKWALPQTVQRNWKRGAIATSGPLASVEAYWARVRVTAVAAAGVVQPVFKALSIDDGEHWVLFPVVQGHSVNDEGAFSTSGQPLQDFTLFQNAVIEGSLRFYVDEPPAGTRREYTQAKNNNFFNSSQDDRHYILDSDVLGQTVVRLGDGVNGKLPRTGNGNGTATYRAMALVDGNVAANAITETGIGHFDQVKNPRAASGFAYPEASTPEDLERLKRQIPARLRANGKVVGADDAEPFALDFISSTGVRVAARAYLLEAEGSTKTSRLLLVGAGGGIVADTELTELSEAINGNLRKKKRGKGLLNHRIEPENALRTRIHLPVKMDGGDQAAVKTALTALLSPLAKVKGDDGKPTQEWQWEPGGVVRLSELIATAMRSTPRPVDVFFQGTITGAVTSAGAVLTGATNAIEELNVGDEIKYENEVRHVAEVAEDNTITIDDEFTNPLVAVTGLKYEKNDIELSETSFPTVGNVTFPEA